MPSPTQETPSSTVDNIPQSDGDFASWLTDRLEKFEKGEETPPWEQKQEEAKEETTEPEAEREAVEEKPLEEEVTTEEEQEDDSEETKNMSASAGAKFKELKSELKTYKSRVAELEKAVEEAKASPQNSEEIERMREQLQEYEQEIAISRVEATPDYKRAVLEPTNAILDSVSSLAEKYKIDTRKLVSALREESVVEGSDALTELAADFSERDRVRLYRMADDLSDVARRRDFLRENAFAAAKEHEAKMAQMQKEYREHTIKEMSQAVDKTWDELFKEKQFINSMDQKDLENVRRFAKETDYFDAPPNERAYAVYSGLLLPLVVAQLDAAQNKAAELEKALSKYKKATPKVSGNADTAPVQDTSTGGFLEAIEKRFGG